MVALSENVKKYLWEEFRRNNIPKYYKYFNEWIENLTDEQITFYSAYAEGKKTIVYCIDKMHEIAGVPAKLISVGTASAGFLKLVDE